jgi:hypothetical protein
MGEIKSRGKIGDKIIPEHKSNFGDCPLKSGVIGQLIIGA